MGNRKRRAAVMFMAAAVTAATVTGCAAINTDATVVTVGEDHVTMGVANFYARYQQALAETQYGAYMGDNMWNTQVTDTETMEDNMKKSILETLERMYVLEDYMKDYNVELTDEDNQKIAKAAKEFVKANGNREKETVSGDEETVKRVLSLLTIQEKMREAIIADVDTNISDEEAAQKSMQYVSFPFTKTGEDGKTTELNDQEKKELKKTAEEFAAGAKTAADFEAYAKEKEYTAVVKTFDKKETMPSEELIKAADTLKEGEFTDIIENKNGYYVAKLTSLFDQEATEAKKKEIVSQRQDDKFTTAVDGLVEKAEIKVNQKQWKKISFQKQSVTMKQQEEKETKEQK